MHQHLLLSIFFSFISFSFVWGENNFSWEQYKQDAWKIHTLIPGWCDEKKAKTLMDFVYETKPMLCVEIGTLAGATTFSMVSTLKFLEQGILYAIDAWDNQACLEGLEPDDPNLVWWPSLKIDMDETHRFFCDWLKQLQLQRFCIPIRMRSDQAVRLFADDSIDLLFIDGNISTEGSLKDATLYFPKVKEGGYIWLNLADHPPKYKTVAFLMRHCEWIRKKSIDIHCILFRKPVNSNDSNLLP